MVKAEQQYTLLSSVSACLLIHTEVDPHSAVSRSISYKRHKLRTVKSGLVYNNGVKIYSTLNIYEFFLELLLFRKLSNVIMFCLSAVKILAQ